jgi:glucosamine kinase
VQGVANSNSEGLGLGLDAGGTQTRWALVDASGVVVAEGTAGGLSALQMGSSDGRAAMLASLAGLAQQLSSFPRPSHVCAGFTGLGGNGEQLGLMLSDVLAIARSALTLSSDIEIAYLDLFQPGQGYLVYAGTGSIAAFIDEKHQIHRAGGRGGLLDDGGGGYWIARQALRQIWRLEDEQPGAWLQSSMARAVFDQIGGAHWDHSRQFMYGQSRGEIGLLALTVAASAATDARAMAILRAAGKELARLAQAMITRFGLRPVVLSGRVVQLHPVIEQTMRASLDGVVLDVYSGAPHIAAARLAVRHPMQHAQPSPQP